MQSIKDTYLRITDAIIEQLEAGAKPWIRPVFNIEQIENLPDRFYRPAEELPATPVPHLETVEPFVRDTGAAITYGGTTACCRPAPDDILTSDRVRFVDEVHLYSTVLHKMSHWSGAKHRLDRDLSGRFGSESYAIEELVAELSASFLCADLVAT